MTAPPFRYHTASGLWVVEPPRPAPPASLRGWIGRLQRWWERQANPQPEDELLDLRESDSVSPVRYVPPLLGPMLLIPILIVLKEPENEVAAWTVVFGGIAFLYAWLANWLERRSVHMLRLQMVNAAVFAAAITGVLYVFVTVDHPRVHVHWIIFFLYFLLIGSTGLADDPRLSVFAGTLSIAGYLFLIPFVLDGAARDPSSMAGRVAPEFEWVANAAKVALLAGTTVTASASAARGRALRRLSLRDGLTGLLNRHAFDACLTRQAERAARLGLPLAVAMVDLDEFKSVNDLRGHPVGDAALRWVAHVLQSGVRTTDVVARYGGEEFVIGFLDSDDERLSDRLETLRERIAAARLYPDPTQEEMRISVSIGIATLPTDGTTIPDVLRCADERMYRAKQAGRNRLEDGRAA